MVVKRARAHARTHAHTHTHTHTHTSKRSGEATHALQNKPVGRVGPCAYVCVCVSERV